MADKLLIEIEMLNDKADDAVYALIYLANCLAESPRIHVRDDWDWDQHALDNYRIKWRFSDADKQETWMTKPHRLG